MNIYQDQFDYNNDNNGGLFAGINIIGQSSDSHKINLLHQDETTDSQQKHFFTNNKRKIFHVALFNYQSRKSDPAVLAIAIVPTTKGASKIII